MKEKKSAETVHKRIKNTSLVNAVDEGNVSRWASQIAGTDKRQAELSDTRRSGRSKTAVALGCFPDELI
jgi:hypothetical protein